MPIQAAIFREISFKKKSEIKTLSDKKIIICVAS